MSLVKKKFVDFKNFFCCHFYNESENRRDWVPGETNSDYLPPYRRVDVRLSKEFPVARTRLVTFLEVSNLLNFENVYGYDYRFTRDGLPFREEIVLWPVIPSLGVTLKF